MRILRRKTLRDLWQIRGRALVVALTVAAGVGIHGGIWMAIETGFHTREVLFQRMGFADLEVQFLPEDVANLPDLARVPGVRAVERRLVLPGTVTLPGNRKIVGVLVCLERTRPSLNALEILDGGPIRAGDFESAVIDRSLATFHGFRVGDRIGVQVGRKLYESRIDGVVVSPEYLITTANPDYFVPERGSVAVVFTDIARVSDALGFTMVNDLLIRFEPGVDQGAATAAVVARLGRQNLERVIPREQHFIWKYAQLAMEAFAVYAPSIALTFGTLSFVLTLVTVNRLVLNQRREIGALLALGYRSAQVLRAYAGAGMLLGGAGGAIGLGFSFAFRNLFAGIYGRAVGTPEIIHAVLPRLLAITFVVAVAGTAVAAALPAWRLLRRPPVAIVRAPVREGIGPAGWIRWTVAAMAALPLPIRFGIRNILRQPGRAGSTILAIGLSLGVALAYVVSLRSAVETSEIVFAREDWDLAVDFLYPVALEDLEAIRAQAGIVAVEPYFRRFAEIGSGGRFEPAGILGVQRDSAMQRPLMRAGRFLGEGRDEVVIGQDVARRLGVGVGDRVTVKIRQDREFTLPVVGISAGRVPGQVTMPFATAQAVTEFGDAATGVYVRAPDAGPALATALGELEYVGKVTAKAGVAKAFRALMAEMLELVFVAGAVSIAVAVLFIAMSVNLVIGERQAEYATLKCLGYGRRRLGATVLAQALGEGGLAALVSVPLGVALAVYLNARLSRVWFELIDVVRPADVGLVLAAALALIPVAVYPGLRKVQRLNIAEALGSRHIE